jgi:hypothetical protein
MLGSKDLGRPWRTTSRPRQIIFAFQVSVQIFSLLWNNYTLLLLLLLLLLAPRRLTYDSFFLSCDIFIM